MAGCVLTAYCRFLSPLSFSLGLPVSMIPVTFLSGAKFSLTHPIYREICPTALSFVLFLLSSMTTKSPLAS